MIKKITLTLCLALITSFSWAQNFGTATPVDGGTVSLDVTEITTTVMNDSTRVVVFPVGANQTFTVPDNVNYIEYLVVGGGGGGAFAKDRTAGGGAGGRVTESSLTVTPGATMTITVGAGGQGGLSNASASSGGNSSLTYDGLTYTAPGGGYGERKDRTGVNGGGRYHANYLNNISYNNNGVSPITPSYTVYNGGVGSENPETNNWDVFAGGGGAGHGGNGENAYFASGAGDGGIGYDSSITGATLGYGGGGGGGVQQRQGSNDINTSHRGLGQDGGGDGAIYDQGGSPKITATSGTRGGGGGGGVSDNDGGLPTSAGYGNGGDGGDGVVVLRYMVSNPNFYVENGTCKCENAADGETGYVVVNGIAGTFTKRDYWGLWNLINDENWDEVQKTCTSGIDFMIELFDGASNFNTDINHWDVSNVTNMIAVFEGATSFNQPLNNWDVSNVTSMNRMFSGATSFNQPINNWDVSNVIEMDLMFQGASGFNQSIDSWDVSSVYTMRQMFQGASAYNQSMNNWDVSNVQDMSEMFKQASSYNQPIDNWDVSSVRYMNYMFEDATSFNQPLDQWNVSNVTTFEGMFKDASAFNKPLGTWNLAGIGELWSNPLNSMFENATSFNQDLTSWCVEDFIAEPTNFSTGSALSSANKPGWGYCGYTNNPDFYIENGTCKCPDAAVGDTASMSVNGISGTFTKRNRAGLDALVAAENWDEVQRTCTTGITDMSSLFEGQSTNVTTFNKNINHWDVSSVTTMEKMFWFATSFNQPLYNWDVSNVTDMEEIFREAQAFNQSLSNWDVSNVTTMRTMFYRAYNFNQPLGNWNVSNVTNMGQMFNSTAFNHPLNNWDVSNVTLMDAMFYNASNFDQPLDNWNVSNVTNMNFMFWLASNFNQDLSGWCVEGIASTPLEFSSNSALDAANLPNWGASCDISIDLDSETLDLAVSRISSGNNVTLTGTNPTINQAMSGTGDLVINTTSLTMSESVNVGNLSITTTNGTTFSGSNKTLQASGTMTLNTDVDVTGSITLSATQATLAKGKHIEVTGSLTNNATVLEMDSDSNEFATLRVNGGSMSGTGDMAYNRYVNSFPNNDLVSAPFAGMTFGAMISDSGNDALMANPDNSAMYLFGTYDTATDSWTNFTTTANANQALVAGKGYRAGGNNTAGDDFATFKTPDGYNYSALTTGVDIALDNAGNGWNLVGNPYPTYLSLADVLSANSDVMHQGESWGVYAYNGDYGDGNDADDWLVFNSSNADGVKIAPGQGFFIRTDTDNQNYSFTTAMQSNTGGDDFIAGRSTTSESKHIKLRLGNGQAQAHTDIYLNTNGSNGLDIGYDSSLFQNAPAEFALYSHLVADNQGLPMAIQTLNTNALTNPSTTAIPLGVESVAGTQLTFGIDTSNLPVGTQVFLEDAQNNSFTDLTQQDYVVGISDALSGTGRFYIHLGQNSTLSSNDNAYQYLQVYAPKGSGTIVLSGLVESGMSLELYDLLGRNVMTQELEATNGRQAFAVGHLADGTYVVRLQGNKGSRAVKVVLSK